MGRAQDILAGRPARAHTAFPGGDPPCSPLRCPALPVSRLSRLSRLVLAGSVVALLAFLPASPVVDSALASPLSEKQAELEAARGRLSRLQEELDAYAAAYGEAEARQAEIDDAIVSAEADEQRSRADLGTVQDKLNRRMVSYYKSRGSAATAVLEVFFTQKSLAGALAQIGQLQRVADQDQGNPRW